LQRRLKINEPELSLTSFLTTVINFKLQKMLHASYSATAHETNLFFPTDHYKAFPYEHNTYLTNPTTIGLGNLEIIYICRSDNPYIRTGLPFKWKSVSVVGLQRTENLHLR
jgi:hypothetical protein